MCAWRLLAFSSVLLVSYSAPTDPTGPTVKQWTTPSSAYTTPGTTTTTVTTTTTSNSTKKSPLVILVERVDDLIDLTETEEKIEVVGGRKSMPWIPQGREASDADKPTIKTTTASSTAYQTPTQPQPRDSPKVGALTQDVNMPGLAQKLTAQVFDLYDKWHGVIVEDDSPERVPCDVTFNHVHVTDGSVLNGDGKLLDEDFSFQGIVGEDGSLNLTFSESVSEKLSNCTLKNVDGYLSFDPDRGVWTYRGNITDRTEKEETFVLEPVVPGDKSGLTTAGTGLVKGPKIRADPGDYEIRNDDVAWLALVVCGGLLFLLLFGFLLGKAIAG